MPRYRCDTTEQNPDGSTSHYATWMGGPTLSKITNCLTEDGTRRTVTITNQPDSFFTIPAITTRRHNGKSLTIKGFVTSGDFGNYKDVMFFVSTDPRPHRYISPEYRTMLNLVVDRPDPANRIFPQGRRNALAFQPWGY